MFFRRLATWLFIGFFCSFILRLLLLFDINKRMYNHTPGPCRYLPFIENGTLGMDLSEGGELFISVRNRSRGFVAVYRTENNKNFDVEVITIKGADFDQNHFLPGAIALYESKGRITFYIVNQHPARRGIEFFSYQKDKRILIYRKTLQHPEFGSAMGLTAVGPDRLFITTFSYFGDGQIGQHLEFLFQSSFGALLFFDGKAVRTIERMATPSSVAYDSKNRILYVASYLNEFVRVYDLGKDLSLTQRVEISLLSSPKSIFVDRKTGELWLAMQPVLYQAFLQSRDPTFLSSSQVLRIRMQSDQKSWVITEPYSNDGASISATSTVALFGEQMAVGGLYGKILICDLVNPQIT